MEFFDIDGICNLLGADCIAAELGANTFADDSSPAVIGCPNAQSAYWERQTADDSCAPTAEGSIIRQFGFEGTSADFAEISQTNGWYKPGEGTSPSDMGKMMDAFGIRNHTNENASINDLADELRHGHGVIVGVRSDQLWNLGPMSELWNAVKSGIGLDTHEFSPADHALAVTGIDLRDIEHPLVILNDSGDPRGQAISYPLDRFMDAWENGNFAYVATDVPIPSLSNSLVQKFLAEYDWPLPPFDADDLVRSI